MHELSSDNKSVQSDPAEIGEVIASMRRGLDLLGEYLEYGSRSSLDSAIDLFSEAECRYMQEQDDCLYQLEKGLLYRYRATGSMDDRQNAYCTVERALGLHAEEGLSVPAVRHSVTWSELMLHDFKRTSDLESLDCAITELKRLASENSERQSRIRVLNALSRLLNARFEQTTTSEDIESAIEASENALGELKACSSKPKCLEASCLNTHGVALFLRFGTTASDQDLSAAIDEIQSAVIKLPSQMQPDYPIYCCNLGKIFIAKFDLTGNSDDLRRARRWLKAALRYIPNSHIDRVTVLLTFASAAPRSDAVNLCREALELLNTQGAPGMPRSGRKHIELGRCFHCLAVALFRTPFRTSIEFGKNINEAIDHHRTSLLHTSSRHIERPARVWRYAEALKLRYSMRNGEDEQGNMSWEKANTERDFETGIAILQETLGLIPDGHPQKGHIWRALASLYRERFTEWWSAESGVAADRDEAVTAFKVAALANTSPIQRLISVNDAADLLLRAGHVDHAIEMYRLFVDQLTTLELRNFPFEDQIKVLSLCGKTVLTGVSILMKHNGNIVETISFLERGRDVIAAAHFENYGNSSGLRSLHPHLAESLDRIRDEMNKGKGFGRNVSQILDAKRSDLLKHRFNDLLQEIRGQEGFERFLLSPSPEALKGLARQGPIVYLSPIGAPCAFIVTPAEFIHVPFTRVTEEDIAERTKELSSLIDEDNPSTRRKTNRRMAKFLSWLWDEVVHPVLNRLGFTETPQNVNTWPRVWWIPLGVFRAFPIHAAGYYTRDAGWSATLDRVISSYTTSARVLQQSRSDIGARKWQGRSTSRERVLLLSMPDTPKQAGLHYALEEVKAVSDILPSTIATVNLVSPKRSEVVSVLQTCSVVHFACHGETNWLYPLRSKLLFSDWETNPFVLGELGTANVACGRFAYISACHSASSGIICDDDMANLASCFTVAGFPAVVGSLWQIQDRYSAWIVKKVYSAMVTEGTLDVEKASMGLHFAIRELRNRLLEENRVNSDPLTWAPYLYLGV